MAGRFFLVLVMGYHMVASVSFPSITFLTKSTRIPFSSVNYCMLIKTLNASITFFTSKTLEMNLLEVNVEGFLVRTDLVTVRAGQMRNSFQRNIANW